MITENILPGSFRDPSGFLFTQNSQIYRQINHVYKDNYDLLMRSGLYQRLTENKKLISHDEIKNGTLEREGPYKTIQPEKISFISYPYEWCFGQLKDAALLMLDIQKTAIEYGLSLKDASAYNIQFKSGRPIFIDTLSFEKYEETKPWIAYRQFCQHFLAPLALMRYSDIRLNQLLKVYIDGVPLDLASRLLSMRTQFHFSLFLHIHMRAKFQKDFASRRSIDVKYRKNSRLSLLALVDNLETTISKMRVKHAKTEWNEYYQNTNYSEESWLSKKNLVSELLDQINPAVVWDLGANTGIFSRLAASKGIETISFDSDPLAIEQSYQIAKNNNEKNILPLCLDLTNPSPGIGWQNEERMSLIKRADNDTVLALALIHHLAITHNIPLGCIAEFLSRLCKNLIIEFIPKDDSQVQKMLSNREDIFSAYSQSEFEAAFSHYFDIVKRLAIKDTKRSLYQMRKK